MFKSKKGFGLGFGNGINSNASPSNTAVRNLLGDEILTKIGYVKGGVLEKDGNIFSFFLFFCFFFFLSLPPSVFCSHLQSLPRIVQGCFAAGEAPSFGIR